MKTNTKWMLLIAAVLLLPLSLHAQEKKSGKNWISKSVKKVGAFLDDIAIEGVDTSYLSLPKYGWKFSATVDFAGINAKVKGNNIPTYGNIKVDTRSELSGQTTLSFGYRGLSARYSFDMAHGYSKDLNIGAMGSALGLEFRSHSTEGLKGTLDASATDGDLPVHKGDTKLHATIINGYYVFNHRHYSLPAAMQQSLIQRRSSGSITAYTVFMSAKLEAKNSSLSTMLGGIRKIEFYQAAVGLGYGYNFTPNQGRLLMHISAAPLLVFFNKNFLTADTAIPLPDGTSYSTSISKEVETKHRYFLTGVARASIIYNISHRFFVSTAALVNDIRFNSATGVKISMDDWVANATVGVRF